MAKALSNAGLISLVAIVGCVVSYLAKGSIPDVLTMVTTTATGGFLGMTIPNTKTETKL
jgi:fucose permease